MAAFLGGGSSRVSSVSSCRARPPELPGAHIVTDIAAEPEQGCNVSSTRASCSSPPRSSTLATYPEHDGELSDALAGIPSPIGCSSLLSELGTIISSQTDMDSKDMTSFTQTDTLHRTSGHSMRTLEEQTFLMWESVCMNIGIIVAFAAADLIHLVTFGDQLTGLCASLYILYPVLVLVLLLTGISGCWCSCCQYRITWFFITALHAAVGLISGLWRELGSGAACTAGLLQFLAIVLYPVDLLNAFSVSLGLVPAFIVFQVARAAPTMVIVEGVLILVAIGIGACIICFTMGGTGAMTLGTASAAPAARETVGVLSLPLLILQRISSRRSWQDSSASRQSDIQTLFAPVFVGDSALLTPMSGELPEVTTRLDRLVSRLVATKDNIERSSLDGELRRVLTVVLGFLLKELKDVSSLHLVPMEELSQASPMTFDFVRKTLNQQADYVGEGQCSPTVVDENATEHTSGHNKHRRSLSFQKFVEEQTKPARTSSKDTLDRVSTEDSTSPEWSNTIQEAAVKRDLRKMLWMGNPETPATFDQAISAMMSCLTFCEYMDELPPPRMGPELADMLSKDLGTWSFDVFKLSRLCENRPLVVVGESALRHLVGQMGLEAKQVTNFLDAIEARYHSTNSYHNSMHAADVMNSVLYFLHLRSVRLEGLEPIEQLSSLIAAAAHDVGHNSKANRYHVAAETPLAMLFNDQSVLENMHCALTFAVLHGEAANFLAVLDTPLRSAFRSLVLQQILDTDLAKHIQTVSRFRQEFLNKDVGEEYGLDAKQSVIKPSLTVSQRKELLCFLLKSADVSGSVKPFDLHVQWTIRINTEFFDQGDVERDLGLPCSPFCDRHGTNLAESQCGFFDFIVAPLYTALDEYLGSRRLRLEVLPELERNRAFWKRYDGLTFDYSNPMSNGDMLRRLFIGGLTRKETHFFQQEDMDHKADDFQKTPSADVVPTPTLLSPSFSKICKQRLSSKEAAPGDGSIQLHKMATGPVMMSWRQAHRVGNQA